MLTFAYKTQSDIKTYLNICSLNSTLNMNEAFIFVLTMIENKIMWTYITFNLSTA